MKDTSSEYTLYASPASYFSGKLRAYLNFKSIPYNEQLCTLEASKTELIPNIGKQVIPVLKSPQGEYLQDTTVIIDELEKRFPDHSIYPSTPKQKLVALMLEVYGDEWLLMPAMHYRWHFKKDNFNFIVREFGKSRRPNSSKFRQYLTGLKIALYFGNAPWAVLGISKSIRPNLEQWTENFLAVFNEHLNHHDYLLGSKPSIADYGFMGPLYAHLGRDPYPKKILQATAPNVVAWIDRMNNPTEQQRSTGQFLDNDQIPETLFPILEMMFAEHLPVLKDTLRRVEQWVQKNPERRYIKRFLGNHQFSIGNVSSKRQVQSFTQWMAQRPLDFYQNLNSLEQQEMDLWLAQVPLGQLASQWLKTPIKARLSYVNHRTQVMN